MKILLPFITLFLASCGVHNHRYDENQDTYYQQDYYANDNYDPYYGYGSAEYSSAGDGVYFNNNYNYYPDRWGITYSDVNYSPYRFPRVGFYYSSNNYCGYSYWPTWCTPGLWSSSYRIGSWWPSYGFSVGFSAGYGGYYDNYWWYNHYRHRNYNHYKPTQQGRYSARNEAIRLKNNRYYNQSKYSRSNYNRNNIRSNPSAVNRGRSSSNKPVNRSRIKPTSHNKNQRYRSSVITPKVNQYHNNQSARSQVVLQSNRGLSQNNAQSRYQLPSRTFENDVSNKNTDGRSINSQSPVYHSNTLQGRRVVNNHTVQLQRSQNNSRPSNQIGQSTRQSIGTISRGAINNSAVQNKPRVQTTKYASAPKSQRTKSSSKQSKSHDKKSTQRSSSQSSSTNRGRRN